MCAYTCVHVHKGSIWKRGVAGNGTCINLPHNSRERKRTADQFLRWPLEGNAYLIIPDWLAFKSFALFFLFKRQITNNNINKEQIYKSRSLMTGQEIQADVFVFVVHGRFDFDISDLCISFKHAHSQTSVWWDVILIYLFNCSYFIIELRPEIGLFFFLNLSQLLVRSLSGISHLIRHWCPLWTMREWIGKMNKNKPSWARYLFLNHRWCLR